MIRETPIDRENQILVANFLGEMFGWSIIHTDSMNPVDCFVGNEDMICEIKNRFRSFQDFDTLMISCRKVHDLVRRARAMKRDGYLAVAWDDAVGILRVYTKDFDSPAWFLKPEMGGRFDRPDDATALEPCYWFPIQWFVLLRAHLKRRRPSRNAAGMEER